MIELLQDTAMDAYINILTYANRYICTHKYIELKRVLNPLMWEQDSKVQLQSCFL